MITGPGYRKWAIQTLLNQVSMVSFEIQNLGTNFKTLAIQIILIPRTNIFKLILNEMVGNRILLENISQSLLGKNPDY